MLVTNDLVKEYAGKTVVNHLNIRIEPGEIYGFIGPNGAGKSTTIQMILGLIPPTRGEIQIFGRSLAKDCRGIKSQIGVVGEVQHFYPEMTGSEYLAFFARLFSVIAPERRITELLERVDLTTYRDLQLRAYSKGMQQKLALARALLPDPELLILDEPVTSLDPQGIKQVRDLILEQNQNGKTVFISSHLLSEIEKTCHRIGIIHHGVLLAEDTMPGLKEKLSSGTELLIELESYPPGIADDLRTLPFVCAVAVDERVIKVGTGSNYDYRKEIAQFFVGHGCLVISMTCNQMSLEEAFVAITEQNISLLTKQVVGA